MGKTLSRRCVQARYALTSSPHQAILGGTQLGGKVDKVYCIVVQNGGQPATSVASREKDFICGLEELLRVGV